MMLPDFAMEDAGSGFGSEGGMSRNEVDALASEVHTVHNCIVAVRFREFYNEVDTNLIPPTLRNLGRVKLSDLSATHSFGPIAEIAGFDVETDIPRHLRPPVARDQFQSLPPTSMPCKGNLTGRRHPLRLAG